MVPVGEGHGRSCPATPTRRIITAGQLFTFPSPWDTAPLPPRPRPSHERPWRPGRRRVGRTPRAPPELGIPGPSTAPAHTWDQAGGTSPGGAHSTAVLPPSPRDPPERTGTPLGPGHHAGPAKVSGSGGRKVAVAVAVPCAVARVTQPGAQCSLGQAGAPRGWHAAGACQCISLGTSQREWGAGTWPSPWQRHHGPPWAHCHSDPLRACSAIKPFHNE